MPTQMTRQENHTVMQNERRLPAPFRQPLVKLGATGKQWFAVSTVLVLATVLRLWGIQHDLPNPYFGDETNFLQRSLAFASGDLNPHWFHKPTFYMYLLFFEYGVYYLFGLIMGWWSSASDFAVGYILDPSAFYLIGRVTTVAFSLASIVGVYRIGEKHFGRNVGLAAALLLALTCGHIESSRVIKADIPTTCFGVWSMYYLLNYLKDRRTRGLVLSCILAGIGAATKYYSIIMVAPIVLVILIGNAPWTGEAPFYFRRCSKAFLLAGATLCASFSVASPYNLLDERGREQTFGRFVSVYDSCLELVSGERNERLGDHISKPISYTSGFASYGDVLFSVAGMGRIVATICILGFLFPLHMHKREHVVLALFVLTFMLASVLSSPGYADPRHQCSIYPFLAVSGGCLIVSISQGMKQKAWLANAALFVVLTHPTWSIIQRTTDLSYVDTRTVAKRWVEEHIPAGSKMLVSEHGPHLHSNIAQIDDALRRGSQADAEGQFTAHYSTLLSYQRIAASRSIVYELYELRMPWWRDRLDSDGVVTLDSEYDRDMGNPLKPVGVESYEYYVENGFEYVIVKSSTYDRFSDGSSNASKNFPSFAGFYHDLFKYGQLVKEFSPADGAIKGPVVRIYEFTAINKKSP